MGIAERKEREKQKMKEDILDAAMKIFLEHGMEKTSIRKIANRIEYSPATIYLYFKDKDEILYELHLRSFTKFRNEIQKAGFIQNPFERLRFIGRNYIDFALKNPEMYDLMFIMRSPMNHHKESGDQSWEVGSGAFQFLENTVQECLEQELIKAGDHRGIAYNMWSYVHGICCLSIRDRMVMYGGEEDLDIVLQSYDYLLNSMKT